MSDKDSEEGGGRSRPSTGRHPMPDPRPMTVSELVFRLADFEGDEPVYFGDRWPVCSAERVWDSTGAVVILSASPPREEPDPRRYWRAVAEAIRGLANARVSHGPLGGYQPRPKPGAQPHPPQGGTGTVWPSRKDP